MIVVTIIAIALWLAIPFRAKHVEVKYLLCVVSFYFVQDPLRKILPGSPPYLQLLFTSMVAILYILYRWRGLVGNYPQWAWPFLLSAMPLVLVLVLSTAGHAHELNILVTTLGFFTYLFFAPVFLLTQDCLRSEEAIIEFMRNYVLMSSIQIVGVWMEFVYGEQIKSGIGYTGHLYDDKLNVVQRGLGLIQYSGFFQAMEPMVFCLALAFMYSITLAIHGDRRRHNVILALAFFVTSLLGIRRKGLLLFGGVLLFQMGLVFSQRKILVKKAVGALVLLVAVSVVGGFIFHQRAPGTFDDFFNRFVMDTSEESSSRFEDMTVIGLQDAASSVGPLGAGIGYGAVGAQFLSDESGEVPEGGLGALYWELGVPGLLAVVVVMAGGITMMLQARRYLHGQLKLSLYYSIFGFLLGSLVSFLFSHSMIWLYFSIFMIWLNVGMVVGMAEGDRIEHHNQLRPVQRR